MRKGKVGDEVNRELFEGERGDGFDGQKQWGNRVGMGLILLANSTTSDKVIDKNKKAWPPESCSTTALI